MGALKSIGKGLLYTGGGLGATYGFAQGALPSGGGIGDGLTGAVAGAAKGAAAVVGTGAAVAGVGIAAAGIGAVGLGTAAFGAYKAASFFGPKKGEGYYDAFTRFGQRGINAGGTVARTILRPYQFAGNGFAAKMGNAMLNPIGSTGKAIVKTVGKMTDVGPKGNVRMTGFGRGVVGAGVVAAAIGGIKDSLEQSRQGVLDPNVVTSTTMTTPPKPVSSNAGGATGDLVFAMHNNR